MAGKYFGARGVMGNFAPMPEILLYDGMYSDSSKEFIAQLDANKGQDVTIRVNSEGGSVMKGWGMIAKALEHDGSLKVKVDGVAASMAANFVLFMPDVECLDVSSFVFHRADMWVYTEEDQKWLDSVNAKIRAKMEKILDAKLWEEVTGVSIKQMFEGDIRMDVSIDAKQAKKLGIVKKITTLNASEAKAIKTSFMSVAASTAKLPDVIENAIKTDVPEEIPVPNKNRKMTIEELKSAHPELYNNVVNIGVSQERDRVGAFLVFNDVDPKVVAEGIKAGKPISQTEIAELSRKSLSIDVLAATKKETSDKTVTTEPPVEKTEKEKNTDAFEVEARKKLGLK